MISCASTVPRSVRAWPMCIARMRQVRPSRSMRFPAVNVLSAGTTSTSDEESSPRVIVSLTRTMSHRSAEARTTRLASLCLTYLPSFISIWLIDHNLSSSWNTSSSSRRSSASISMTFVIDEGPSVRINGIFTTGGGRM